MKCATLSGFHGVVKDEQVSQCAGCKCVCAALIIAEFYKHSHGVELLDNGTHLSACKALGGHIGEQGDHIQDGR